MTEPRTQRAAAPAHRQPRNSDLAYSVTLTAKVSSEQYSRVTLAAATAGVSVSEWLRDAVVAALARSGSQ
jgi:predicted HicB family RNase H-like nuclease